MQGSLKEMELKGLTLEFRVLTGGCISQLGIDTHLPSLASVLDCVLLAYPLQKVFRHLYTYT